MPKPERPAITQLLPEPGMFSEKHPHKEHQSFSHRLRHVKEQALHDLRNPKPRKKKKP